MDTSQPSLPRVLRYALPALLLSAACLLPYLNKAFTIDDPVFLLQAQQIRKTPLNPTAMEICWTKDNKCGPVSKDAISNLLMSYCLVPALMLGGQEWLVHSMQLVTLWLGIVATVSLGLRFGAGSFGASAAGLIVAASPPVLAMASTAMPDVLAMMLAIVGIERLWAWKQKHIVVNGILAAAALGLAPYTRIHLALLWPVALLLLRDDARILDMRSWWDLKSRCWPVAGAMIVWIGAILLTTGHQGKGGAEMGHFWIVPEHAYRNFRSYFIDLVEAMPLGIAWLVLRNRKINPWLLAATVVIAVWKIWNRFWPGSWMLLCALVGALVVTDILVWSFQGRDVRRIALALWLLIPLAAIPYIQLPVKYLVPCAPAAALLIVDLLQTSRWRTAVLGGIVTAGVIWGSMVLHADARLAGMARDAVARLVAPQVAAGHRVWFVSQWGFYWYALKAGAKPLWTDQMPAPGDYLARGEMEGFYETLKRLPPADLIETYTISGPCGRTMSPKDNAGLYSNPGGDLMWAWGTGEWNHYELWRFK